MPYFPVLIDATYAGLIAGARDMALVIPALNRDGDCLSDLVLPMFGSIAGAESVLLAFGDDYEPTVVMAEAPHGTAPALEPSRPDQNRLAAQHKTSHTEQGNTMPFGPVPRQARLKFR